MKGLTIGQVAKMGGVNIETIRYYERQGLLPLPPRRESGYRQYPEDTINRVRFIKRAQELGFSLKEVAELLSLRVGLNTTCGDVRKIADGKIAEIEGKIRTLERMRDALTHLVETCEESRQAEECPILWAFDNDEKEVDHG
jgi:MerR family mercuric resistance operon transcriptional regulator